MFYPQLILGWYSVFSIEHQNYPEGIGFAFTTLLDRFLNLHHPTQPISCKTNTNQTWPCMFSRAWCQSSEFMLSTQWLIVMFSFVVVGLCDCFGWVKVVQNESAFYRDFTVIPFFFPSEINAKVFETSSKTGHNVGEWSLLVVMYAVWWAS